VEVIKHLVSAYDIDGLHLDRIRYPEMPFARPVQSPPAPRGFSTGYNAVNVRRFNAAYGRPDGSLPDPWDASWDQWRRDQVTALVRRIYLETIAIRPEVKVSASTITFFRAPASVGGFANTEAYSRVFQDWDGWMRQGILDLNTPMVYKPVAGTNAATNADNARQFTEWTEFARANQHARQAAIGIGVYLNPFEKSLPQLAETRVASADGARAVGQSLYSYATTNPTPPPPSPYPLRPQTDLFGVLSTGVAPSSGEVITLDPPYAAPAEIPEMAWKATPRRGYLLAQVLGADGAPADGAEVTIRKMGGGPRDAEVAQVADGNGYVGATDLAPGAYQLAITTPEGAEIRTVPEPVVPGRVTRLVVNLGSKPRGPMIRAERAPSSAPAADDDLSPAGCWQGREPVAEDVEPPARCQE
jgi:hypothetical protein